MALLQTGAGGAQDEPAGEPEWSVKGLRESKDVAELMPTGIRRQARVTALQSLYEYDTAQHDPDAVLRRHAEERHLDPRVVVFAEDLLAGVRAHEAELDALIQTSAPEWPIAQMSRIDKNILRLAIYEIRYNKAVPARAAINEAVELAKHYGSETSSRFVNGVLGAIVNQVEESPTSGPGSEEP